MKEIYIILAIILLIIIIIIAIRNSLVEKKKKIERNKSLIDVYLKKRFDLIPNLVEVCKGYSKHEKETLENITKLRSSFSDKPNEKDMNELNNVYNKYLALIESYPEIKAGENYLKLQKELSDVEKEIEASRRIYINSITSYNNLVLTFPSSIIAGIFGFQQVDLPSFEYQDVKIKF